MSMPSGAHPDPWTKTTGRLPTQCISVASRPLRVESQRFSRSIWTLRRSPHWSHLRGRNMLVMLCFLTCSSSVDAVTVDGSQIVQFSHFSGKKFLMSSRLARGRVSRYQVSLEPAQRRAHTIVARACLSVLLQLDENINRNSIKEACEAGDAPGSHTSDDAWEQCELDGSDTRIRTFTGRSTLS